MNMSGLIRGNFDAMTHVMQQLQGVSDETATAAQQLGNTFEGLAVDLQGSQSGPACQQMGERLITEGKQFSTTFADQSHMMGNNQQILGAAEEESAHVINAVMSHYGN
ncbi:hypothetical protein BST24_12040 [Mycobacteroides franklinii]|nr:hypothetical protein BST24_12040 [Mycobacteroides franklinii]